MISKTKSFNSPVAQGLYDPKYERDNCGIGLIVDMKGRRSHDIVSGALEICRNLDHRGGCGCDPITGDGAGIFIQLPHKFFMANPNQGISFEIPDEGDYGVGFTYLSKDQTSRRSQMEVIEQISNELDMEMLGWREVPVNSEILGKASFDCEPYMS
jgi:glutamate synthase (ferredoxin)